MRLRLLVTGLLLLGLSRSCPAQDLVGETYFNGPENSERMATDAEGRQYFAAENGLFRFTGDRFERMDSDPEFGLPAVVVYRPEAGRFGYLWIGTTTGLWSYDGSRFRRQAGVARRTVFNLAVDADGTIAAGVGDGTNDDPFRVTLHLYESAGGELRRGAVLGASSRFAGLAFDRDHNLYYATRSAAYLLPPGERKALFAGANGAQRLPFPTGPVTSYLTAHLAADPDGGMWLYARGELVHYTGTQPGVRFRRDNYRPNVTTGKQICASGGKVWFLANHVLHTIQNAGVLRLDPESPTSSTSYRHVYCEGDRAIWVGHNKFVRKFDTARLGNPGGLPMRVQTGAGPWQTPDQAPVTLPFGTHTIQASVGAPRLVRLETREEVQYRLRIRGFMEDWAVSAEPVRSFTVNQPGRYRLEADFAVNGKWSGNPRVYAFEVAERPIPLWSWPLAVGAIIAVGLTAVIWRQRQRENAWGISSTLLGQRYRITAKLAETDLSQVFLAQDLRLGKRAVALKVIRRKSVEKSALSAFRRELEALSRLRHRGIVAILDVGVLPDGRAFLVMELVDGVSPRTILRQGAMERRRMARVLSQLGDTMAVTHRNGILHRDLKPENLMLEFPGTDRENLVILDFGTARIAVPDGSVDSYSGGTLDYMAPEQLFGFSSEKTDLYAVALLAFEMLTGKRLTELMCENPKEVDAALRRELASVLPAVPVAAIDLILHGANPDPALRPEDLEEWTGALTNILTQSGNI